VKITILVPSVPYLDTAGVRIRYRRLIAPLARLGWTLDIMPIDDVPDLLPEPDRIYVLSKCQDARALALATAARRAGILVGVDLFDDYFSQDDDPRFAGQRLWLRAMAKQASFFLCSTPRMLDVGNRYFGSGAGHVLGDPHDAFDPVRLKQELAVKTRKAKRERRIPILWFGIADNPNFPVGLHDLATYGEALRPLQDNNYKAELTILTNRNSVDSRTLERLRRLPIPFVIREWTKAREEEALSRCLVSFLPVNFQQFSIAKSLNRGVSALVGGTQLLTAGYPLYDKLGAYVYDDAARLIADLENESLHLSSENVVSFSDWIGRRAAPDAEALHLLEFLDAMAGPLPDEADEERQYAVLHGAKSAESINSFTQRLDWLSLASPLLPAGMMCDAHLGFFGGERTLRLRVSQSGLEQLPEELRVTALWADKSLGKGPAWDVPLVGFRPDFPLDSIAGLVGRGACADAALNAEVLTLTRNFFMTLFQRPSIVDSELDPVGNIIRALERI
jgi:hypothetical protein